MLETKFGIVPVFGIYGEAFVRALAPHFQRMVFIPDDVIVEVIRSLLVFPRFESWCVKQEVLGGVTEESMVCSLATLELRCLL